MKEFSKEDLVQLEKLVVELTLNGDQLEGKFGANTLTPYDVINNTNVSTLRTLLGNVRRSIQTDSVDDYSITPAQLERNTRFEKWAAFLNFSIGFKLDKEKKDNDYVSKVKKMRELESKINAESEKNKTLADFQAELDALKKSM